MRGSVSNVAASGGGDGNIVSHVSGARLSGSWARMSCRIVVPVRGNPMMNTGATICSSAIAGNCLRSLHVAEPVDRVPERAFARDQPTDLVEAGLAFERLEEQRQRFEERPVTEIVESAGTATGFGDDRLDGERFVI